MEPPESFHPPGTRLGRYEIISRLGYGGMGVVYKAHVPGQPGSVALKTLRTLEPAALLRLKNEFRYLANVAHPNLVSLHELVCDERTGEWFFAMDLVDGESLQETFQTAVETGRTLDRQGTASRPLEGLGGADPAATLNPDATLNPEAAAAWQAAALRQASTVDRTVDDVPDPLLGPEQLRRIFGQLAAALQALHSADRVHCDVKPANVMVTPAGRVVLLDFGLAYVSSPTHYDTAEQPSLAGTPGYMAPEQAEGRPPTPAADWYALGVMLYEALCGRPPFEGTPRDVLISKCAMDAPDLPADLPVPPDLATLTMRCLSRAPDERPSGPDVLSVLHGERPDLVFARPLEAGRLIGREDALAELGDAYDAAAAGGTVTVHIRGRSGMGKSALADRFLSGLRRDGAIVLVGRCFERESVPYNALDSVVDSLTRWLRRQRTDDRDALVPKHAAELVQMFPVLRRVPALAAVPETRLDATEDRHALRRRAFRALRSLFRRLSETAPLVVYIDDLQWGDRDSGVMLSDLVAAPDPPSMLLLCAYRSEEAAGNAFVETQRRSQRAGRSQDIRTITVGPLGEADATRLAAALLGTGAPTEVAARVAREAAGSPFFVGELVRYLRFAPDAASSASLDDVVMARVARLPEPARRLLRLVCVAGRPTEQGIIAAAAALETEVHGVVNQLRASRLVRARGVRAGDTVEPFHDRIRETVYGGLDDGDRRRGHLRLAETFEGATARDPEVLALHFLEADRPQKAGPYSAEAGDQASAKLAFDHAAKLYRQALACTPETEGLTRRLADALANAGRGAEAAPEYLRAASASSGAFQRRLKRRAAEQYLVSGHISDGVRVIKPLVAEAGLTYPKSPTGALLGMIGRLVRLDLGGLRYQPREATEVPEAALERIDIAWAAGKGLGSVDIMRGAYFIVRAAGLALKAGEPTRIALGLSQVGLFNIARGVPREIAKGWRQLALARQIALEREDPHLMGFERINRGMAHMTLGQWSRSREAFEAGIERLADRCTGVAWELSFGRTGLCNTLRLLGDFAALGRHGAAWLRDAEERGDTYGAVWIRLHSSTTLVAADDPIAALAQVESAVAGWSAEVFTPQHALGVMLAAEIALYQGEPRQALARWEAAWKPAHKGFAMGWQINRIFARQIRCGALLAVIQDASAQDASAQDATSDMRRKQLKRARADIKAIRKEGQVPWGLAAVAGLEATVARLENRLEDAVTGLRRAVEAYAAVDMPLYEAAYRWRLGQQLGGADGAAAIAAAQQRLAGAGVRNPRRFVAMYAPGWPEV